MKKKYLTATFIVFSATSFNFGCALQFTNDLKKVVFIADDLGKAVLLNPGATQEINPAKNDWWKYLSKERLYIYKEVGEQNKLQLVYRLIDDYCTDDVKANAFNLSDIDNKNEKITKRFRIKEYKL